MAGLRFNLDLFIPEDSAGTLVAGVKIPNTLAQKIPAIKLAILSLKAYATKINAGQPNEEMTVRAVFHICHHDTGGACEAEIEI